MIKRIVICLVLVVSAMYADAQLLPALRAGISTKRGSGGYTYSDTSQFITGISNVTQSGWQNLSNSGSAPHSVVKSATNATTSISLSTVATGNWTQFVSATSNSTGGEDTDDGGGFFFPSAVQRTILFNYSSSFSGSNWNLRVGGLTEGSEYVIQLMASRDAAAVSTATREMRAVCSHFDGQSEVDDFDVKGNTSEPIQFIGVKPKAGGTIDIWIGGSGTDGTDQYKFGYVCGVRVYKRVAN